MADSGDYDVFLSHHSADKPWVIFLKAALRARGIRVWLDRDEIRPGDLFVDALEQGIQRSRCVAVIVSPGSMKSQWVKEEYSRALGIANSARVDLRLIPCLLRDATLPGFLESRNWIDFRDPAEFDAKVDELCWGVTGTRPSAAEAIPVRAPRSEPDVTPAEVAFLDRFVEAERKEMRDIRRLRWAAPVLGLGVAVVWPPLSALPSLGYAGPALVTGLLGVGVTARRWSRHRNELKRLTAHRDALALCLRSPGPVCPDVVEAFNRFIKLSIGVAAIPRRELS